jgi:copper chaperone
MMNQQIDVLGMTCGHCVAAVTKELLLLNGVTRVEVDLTSGRVDLTTTRELSADELAAAVDEAGYSVA